VRAGAVKIDAIAAAGLDGIQAAAAAAERRHFDGLMVPEVAHDPFLPVPLAAACTRSIRLATGIAVAFARNPMTVAVTASDIHRFCDGRFVLGLGTQVKSHVTRRFSMPWSEPAARMREFISAVRAIWRSWEQQTPLDFRGDFYQHTLMTPMFDHGPSPFGRPPIHVAAVGPVMTSVAGEVADGLITHGFTTPDYVRDVTLPRLTLGLQRAGRAPTDIEVCVPLMIAIADDMHDPRIDAMRGTIAFYGSTPAYRTVLEHHGWGALGDELHALSRRGEWQTMATLIDDTVLGTFAAVGDPKTVAATVIERYGGLVDRVQLGVDRDQFTDELLGALRSYAS
jgi:probable F420-dependent oxidoreductase